MKLDRRLITAISKAIAAGCDFQTAARLAKVDRRTLYNWRRRGKKESSGVYHELALALDRADADFIAAQLANIQRHSRLAWQASAWLLERRHPELFGRNDRLAAKEMQELRAELAAIRAELAKPQHHLKIAE